MWTKRGCWIILAKDKGKTEQIVSLIQEDVLRSCYGRKQFGDYWTQTYESLKDYIGMDFDGLKDAIILMLGGGRCQVNTRKFQNDLTSIKSKDDIMTLLVHLGYLAYDGERRKYLSRTRR